MNHYTAGEGEHSTDSYTGDRARATEREVLEALREDEEYAMFLDEVLAEGDHDQFRNEDECLDDDEYLAELDYNRELRIEEDNQ